MNCRLPSGVISEMLACHQELNDQTYEIFGVDCDLIYLPKRVEVPQASGNNIADFNSINSRRRNMPREFDYNVSTFTSQEISEKVRIKIYWNAKEWQTVYGYTNVPENHVMFLAMLSDAANLNRAVKVRFTDAYLNVYIFERVSEAVPYSFNKDRYCSSIWKQSE